MRRPTLGLPFLLTSSLAACDDPVGPEDTVRVTLSITSAAEWGAAAANFVPGTSAAPTPVNATGPNGTLTQDALQIVVDELEVLDFEAKMADGFTKIEVGR